MHIFRSVKFQGTQHKIVGIDAHTRYAVSDLATLIVINALKTPKLSRKKNNLMILSKTSSDHSQNICKV